MYLGSETTQHALDAGNFIDFTLTADRSRYFPVSYAIFFDGFSAKPPTLTAYTLHNAAAAKKRAREIERNGSTVICGGRKVDSGVRTAQLSADENEL